MRFCLMVALLCLLLDLAAAAQAVPPTSSPGPGFEAFAGFSRMRADIGTYYRPNGWTGGVRMLLNRYLGVEGTAGGDYGTTKSGQSTSLHMLLVGGRIARPIWRLTAYVHGGVGMAAWQIVDEPHTGVSFAIAKYAGLGFDFRLTERFSLRLIQGDYLNTEFRSGHNGLFSSGVVYQFAKR